MKVSIQQQQLAHGLGIVSRAVSPRSTLPVLANVLVATDEGRLRLSATNLELTITCWIRAQISEEGSITVPARTFSDLISTLPSDSVTMTLNSRTQTLSVSCLSSHTDIKGINADEFPRLAPVKLDEGIEIKIDALREMIQQTVFAASADDARPVLQGALLNANGNEISLAATDGFRISVSKTELAGQVNRPMNAIIPARALSELARIASDGEQTVTLLVPRERGQIVFHMQDIELISQLIEGNFPDYKVIIPRSFKTHTIVTTAAFLKACKQTEIIAREGTNVVRLNISPRGDQPGVIEISAQSEETGTGESAVDVNIDGPGLVIAFNVRFLREVLDVIKTPNVSLETNSNNTPALLHPVGDDSFQHVIMPMHLG
jgi:DNA polymerase III subunit beta